MDQVRNKNIKITKSTVNKTFGSLHRREFSTNSIKPISTYNLTIPNEFITMDIETYNNSNQIQTPFCITTSSSSSGSGSVSGLIELNNKIIINQLQETKLWDEFFNYLLNNNKLKNNYIFVHNLGSFDGYFIYKALSNNFKPDQVNTIIDHHNKFIQITLKLEDRKFIWLDSYRIFPISLNQLCEVFEVPGKVSEYNINYNSLNLFNDKEMLQQFKDYALQDSISLYKALIKAQDYYLNNYNVDITTIVSTSSLSLKIFRTNFLKFNIPILKGNQDNFIRKSYFGGHTDIYEGYLENGYYYDVNSLYPFCMLKPIPFELIKHHNNMDNIKLENFFGFIKCEVECPDDILKPLLPYKDPNTNKTLYPTGNWVGNYFSEELKALTKYGYKFKLLEGYEYSKIDLFSDYVKHFYNIKNISKGSKKFLAKLQLNTLYGIFGRKLDGIETINIYKKDMFKYVATRLVKTYIEINEDKATLLLHTNINSNIINELNSTLETNFINYDMSVRSNVAISSSITSYARIHMIPFILHEGTVYTDTDSIFSKTPLNSELIGSEIGLMKDELNGLIIKEAYFIDIKKYGYYYLDNLNNRIEKYLITSGSYYPAEPHPPTTLRSCYPHPPTTLRSPTLLRTRRLLRLRRVAGYK
jgi:hypothetical protein